MGEWTKPIVDFQGVVVNKPWGHEYLMYENGTVAVWHLNIRAGARTSMHCHPRKKTGLILISGEARVSFLNDSVTLRSLSKLMIRPGLFHSTAALSAEGITLLEVETPCDKANLVRLEDEYGREEQPYEGPEAISHATEGCICLPHPDAGKQFKYALHECVLCVQRSEDVRGLRNRSPGEIIAILQGGLSSRTGEPVLSPGDVVSANTLDRLTKIFGAPEGVSVLTVRKEDRACRRV